MRKLLLYLFLALLPGMASAQTETSVSSVPASPQRFGYFSYQTVLQSMPAYAKTRRDLSDLSNKYDAEMKREEDEFNNKYEEFLEGERDFAPSILEKRQAELRDLMEKNIAFKEQSKHLLDQAEQNAMAPLKASVTAAVSKIGKQQGLAFVLNTDHDAVPYIDTSLGVDITTALESALR
ncbi:MAG: OmpH family outer membrane protein [Prevotella sp.]|jgi:outer membrane protein|nr:MULTISPECIES: OmpH family outer membrane protein [unclassified Prevotella]MCH3970639.1 OmpH family outer membrane protein [Prevotella sp.]MCH3984983.1 OmpH family outer membrane protein [Prevotella sp.]MCH3991558.1 OmpH family outer membrane protein [Prevotella sp.]MCH4018732.1 OmpH family outer membrane protein [Prevotella sp.]MCH4100115.1 OmpH family outer membrane protein [Prevotella sp.]